MPHIPRLLVVDDDPVTAELVMEIARHVYPDPRHLLVERALSAEDSLLAIRRAQDERHPALVVISDHHLARAGTTGLDLLDEVARRLPRAKRALMTDDRSPDIVARAELSQLDGLVEKPVRFHEMGALIVSLVGPAGARPAQRIAVDAAPSRSYPLPPRSPESKHRRAPPDRRESHPPAE